MLVLSRKDDQLIILTLATGEKERFTLTKFVCQQTKAGLEAPGEVKILREELLNQSWNRFVDDREVEFIEAKGRKIVYHQL